MGPGVSPPALWQNIPSEAKWQILLTIGLFEFYSEAAMAKSPGQGGHYMRGGKPGYFPPFNLPKGVKGESGVGVLEDAEGGPLLPHPVPLNLYDPFRLNSKKSDEWKAEKLKTEINNGRLAMLGLMSLLSEGAVPGSVPLLKGLIPASGEINVMAPLDFTQPLFGNAALAVQGREAPIAALAVGGESGLSKVETKGDLETLAKGLNPVVGFYDPLNLAEAEFWEQSNEATIGFLRHAEIKHGRVAMAGFIGYCIHENGIHFPWTYPGVDWAAFEKMSAPAVWDNLPVGARLQIIVGVGILEAYGENSVALEADGEAHYMRGGKPGYYPTFDSLYHPVPFNLYDPFKLFEDQTEEQKARRLFAEINNGRLAMIGLFSFLLASKSDEV